MGISIEHITKIYGEQKALNDVSFNIETGKIVGFLGPNGAGKSTLMKIITGLIPPTSGNVLVEGINVAENDVRQMIGYLPENNPLYLDMYVREYLQFVADIYGIKNKKQRVDEVIESTGLQLECGKVIGALSKGYKQRVGIAQAIIHNPKVLILDEPTTGLDPNQIIEIRELIKGLGTNKTIILSTHIMQEVQAICNHIAIINRGQLVANGATADVQHIATESQLIEVEFGAEANIDTIQQINGVLAVNKLSNFVYQIRTNKDIDIRPELFNYAVRNNLTVLGMQQKQASLEDSFHQLTNNKA